MAGRTRRIGTWVTVAAGLVIGLTGCGAGAAADDDSGIIAIAIDGYHFVPDHFTVRQGESVRFLISNPDTIGHELFIGTVAEQAERRMAAPSTPTDDETATHFGYGIYIPAFSEGELDYAFSSDTDLLIGCHLPGHWEAGMLATIDVQP